MKISKEQKFDNFRNIRGMMNDYVKQYNRFPTTEKIMEKLGMEQRTVERYKKVILEENKKNLIEYFQDQMIITIQGILPSINDNIKVLEKIKNNSVHDSDRINAAKCIITSKLDALRLMRDGPVFLGVYDNESNISNIPEHHNRRTESEERTTEAVESMFD